MPQDRKVALVTGASSGIGAVFADRLARRGFEVVMVARRKARLEAQAAQLAALTGRTPEVLEADLADPADLAKVEARLAGEADLAMLVNNAGVGGVAPILDWEAEAIGRMIAVNATAVARLSRAALPPMLARGTGTVINVASGLAFAVSPNHAVYGATKAFVAHFTELLHSEVGDRGIQLQCLVPGLTRTNLGDAETTGLFDKFPPGVVMSPEDLVDASLAGLELGELFCFPRLDDPAKWAAANSAIREIGKAPPSDKPAARYRLAR